MIFNGAKIDDYVKVEEIRKGFLPPISSTFKEIPGRPGGKYIQNQLGNKTIEVDIRLIEADKEELQRKVRTLAEILYTEEPKKLDTGEPGKYDMAILDGEVNFETFLRTGKAILPFLCDPLSYGDTKYLEIGGELRNAGTYATTGIINVAAEESDFLEVTLENTKEKIYIKHDFANGDEVEIDLDEETVYKNGLSISKDVYLESDFFMIPKGEFEITLSSGTGTAEFTERWL
jgi:predicted phage tail component-like protein